MSVFLMKLKFSLIRIILVEIRIFQSSVLNSGTEVTSSGGGLLHKKKVANDTMNLRNNATNNQMDPF